MDSNSICTQIDEAVKFGRDVAKKYPYEAVTFDKEYDGDADEQLANAATMMLSTIKRVAEENSIHVVQATQLVDKFTLTNSYLLPQLAGILQSLKRDYEAGYLTSLKELIHGEVFSDLLDQSEYLVDQGFKNPSAVLAGAVLEEHLRKLCIKNGISIVKNPGEHKKLDSMNQDLAKAGVYVTTVQKMITSWAGLRNDAAHGYFDNFDAQTVKLMIFGIRNFLANNPA